MGNTPLDRLRAEALHLPQADRAELAREMVASLDGALDSNVTESAYRQRMRKYIERTWAIAAKTLTAQRRTLDRP